MEKTIEEVAYNLYPVYRAIANRRNIDTNEDKRRAFMAGATEQKAIDDAKYGKLRELAYAMYTKAQYLSTDASGLRKAMEDFYNYINYEEND